MSTLGKARFYAAQVQTALDAAMHYVDCVDMRALVRLEEAINTKQGVRHALSTSQIDHLGRNAERLLKRFPGATEDGMSGMLEIAFENMMTQLRSIGSDDRELVKDRPTKENP